MNSSSRVVVRWSLTDTTDAEVWQSLTSTIRSSIGYWDTIARDWRVARNADRPSQMIDQVRRAFALFGIAFVAEDVPGDKFMFSVNGEGRMLTIDAANSADSEASGVIVSPATSLVGQCDQCGMFFPMPASSRYPYERLQLEQCSESCEFHAAAAKDCERHDPCGVDLTLPL